MTKPSDGRVVCLHGRDELKLEARATEVPGPGEVRVAVLTGGICGSDLQYWLEGGIGTIRVRDPFILGQEGTGLTRPTA
ncbi:alcohol dehydrogenase catalytic domain-containing protein [Pseudotabrizicola sp. 4114]|uniref:alcohol dehydrogenase catalytic domain-containing protein n=1 Tax=Pseudotabrizicola sp. 4114 TaxID=2817731 RepID=UPI0028598647|nr:threonine dehydrogenase-like Zn-dependent dehydrogenase [Pseudorhodobacter sp. 4114]